jgi:molybdenum cofactor cytidylyltransferase
MIFALLPAGGKSVRMGRPKLLLPFGTGTVLEHVIATVRAAGLDRILVVAAPHLPELAALAETAGAQVLLLTEATPDMRSTVEIGLGWVESHWQPRPGDGWLLIPADHPALEPAVLRFLFEARRRQPQYGIIVPTFQGQRGHPCLLDWSHVAGIRTFPAGLGLNTYLRQNAERTLEVPVENASILFDLDTPEDYARLLGDKV